MAINPNTDFSSGAVLTAAQQNRFPRGVMGYAELTANTNNFTAITTVMTVTFTAVANRYYRITYYEPLFVGLSAVTEVGMTIANGATQLQLAKITTNTTYGDQGLAMAVETFTAGSITINARLSNTGGTGASAGRSATSPGFLLVEDIGPS